MKKLFCTVLAFLSLITTLYSQKMKNTIQFSAKPLSANAEIAPEFKWGTGIYAKLTAEKPLKEYAKKFDDYDLMEMADKQTYSSYISFYVCPKTEIMGQRSWKEIKLVLTSEQLEKNTIEFDVMPLKTDASSFFKTGFYAELAKSSLIQYNSSEGTSKGEKTEFDIYLFERPTTNKDNVDSKRIFNFGVYLHLGQLTIDYSTVKDTREVMDWSAKCQEIMETIQSKYKQ